MIKSFKHKGLQDFFETGSLRGIQPMHAGKISAVLFSLNKAEFVSDLNLPSFRLHKLKGSLKNLYSITVQANWRITFEFDEETQDVYIVDYQDYH